MPRRQCRAEFPKTRAERRGRAANLRHTLPAALARPRHRHHAVHHPGPPQRQHGGQPGDSVCAILILRDHLPFISNKIFKKLCAQILYRTIVVLNKYRTVEELRSTFSHIKSINIFIFILVCSGLLICVWTCECVGGSHGTKKPKKNMMTCRVKGSHQKKSSYFQTLSEILISPPIPCQFGTKTIGKIL